MKTIGEAIKQIFKLQIFGVVQADKFYILGCTIYIYSTIILIKKQIINLIINS